MIKRNIQNKITKPQRKWLEGIWKAMYDEYIAAFGFSENFLMILNKQIEIGKLETKKILTGDQSIQTFIDIAKFKLANLQRINNNEKSNIYKVKAAIEKKMGIRIPLAETPVREFYSYLNDLNSK